MVVALSNVIQNVYADQSYGLSGVSTAQISLQTNGVPNANQGLLNLVGAGDVTVNTNALGQTVIESTGTVIPGTGTGSYVVTAFSGMISAPNNDILTADGSGNAKDSGVLVSSLAPKANAALTGTTTIALANITSMNGVLNANDFAGADIGAKVNAAITALGSSGGTVFIPAGSYTQTTTIVKPRNINVVGASADSTILNYTPMTGWSVVIADGLGSSIYPEGILSDLSLIGPGAGTTTGGIYIGGSDGAATSPSTSIDPSTNYGDHININRVRIFDGFGVGIQFGNNTWATTVFQSLISNNGTGISFPSTIGGAGSGERLSFIGCSIQNNTTGAQFASGGAQVDVDVYFTNCSFDYNSSWAVQNLNTGYAVNLIGCHVEQPTHWLQNYGFMALVGCYFTNGTNSSVLGYLIDNEAESLSVLGGFYDNGGSGAILNSGGSASVWVDAVVTNPGSGGLTPVATNIDRFGDIGIIGGLQAASIISLGAISSVGGQASAGNLGVPVVVYAHTTTGLSQVVTNSTVFNTTAAGFYKISGQVWPTTLSITSWYVYPATTCTLNGATGPITLAIGSTIQLGASYNVSSNLGVQMVYLASGATIGISTVASSGGNNSGVYSLAVTIERLA
jgi:hypothetical protein